MADSDRLSAGAKTRWIDLNQHATDQSAWLHIVLDLVSRLAQTVMVVLAAIMANNLKHTQNKRVVVASISTSAHSGNFIAEELCTSSLPCS